MNRAPGQGESGGGTSTGTWILVTAVLAFAVLILPNVLENGRGASSLPSLPGGALSGLPTPAPSGTVSLPVPSKEDGDGVSATGGSGNGTGSTGGSSSGAGSTGGSGGAVPPAPPPDPVAQAFRAVRPGDCLAVYDTGHGRWSAEVPHRVSCGAGNAYLRVSAVRSSVSACSTGTGRGYWYHTSSGGTTVLCLSRQFQVGYCLLAKQTVSGQSTRIEAGLMTAVDCRAKKVPARYNQILHITGVYRAPANASAAHCRRVAGDQTTYWAWLVDGGKVLLCTMVYRS
ncbi:MAG TPA: hypothetical protein VFY14_07380 [Streptomyces sp.]|nr:hypothetical protein [Streptomyces sp.]